jgi:hypothetical protein
MWIYSPGNIAPGRHERLMSQIDIAPTLLGLLGMDYRSQFYGTDAFQRTPGTERAFIGTYQLLGYLRGRRLVQLAPHREVATVQPTWNGDRRQPMVPDDPRLTLQAIAYYQTAAYRFTHGLMRNAR